MASPLFLYLTLLSHIEQAAAQLKGGRVVVEKGMQGEQHHIINSTQSSKTCIITIIEYTLGTLQWMAQYTHDNDFVL